MTESPNPDRSTLRVSVVMPVFNEAPTVEAALARVRSVALNIEIVCVDDASTDGTRDILQRLHAQGLEAQQPPRCCSASRSPSC